MCRRAWFRFGPRIPKTTLRSKTRLQRIFVNRMGRWYAQCMGQVRSGINYDERFVRALHLAHATNYFVNESFRLYIHTHMHRLFVNVYIDCKKMSDYIYPRAFHRLFREWNSPDCTYAHTCAVHSWICTLIAKFVRLHLHPSHARAYFVNEILQVVQTKTYTHAPFIRECWIWLTIWWHLHHTHATNYFVNEMVHIRMFTSYWDAQRKYSWIGRVTVGEQQCIHECK